MTGCLWGTPVPPPPHRPKGRRQRRYLESTSIFGAPLMNLSFFFREDDISDVDGGLGRAGRKLLCRGGGGTRKPIFPTPPPRLLGRRDGRGGSGRGCPTCRAGGGGGVVNPTSMAQNDTHVALIILTTQIWGGGIIGGKNFFGPNFVFLCLWRQHPFLHKTKGPTRNPISPTLPPPSAGVHVTPPPPRRAIFRSPRGLRTGGGLGGSAGAGWGPEYPPWGFVSKWSERCQLCHGLRCYEMPSCTPHCGRA